MSFTDVQLKILVIDDDPDMLKFMTELLVSQRGHLVVLASSAEEGLNQLPFYSFDLALLDQNLPGIEGVVLGTYLQDHNPDMSVVLITGVSCHKLQRLCTKREIHFIEKPFQVEQIFEVIKQTQARISQISLDRPPHSHLKSEAPKKSEGPDVKEYIKTLPSIFKMPTSPKRIQDQLSRQIRDAIERIRMRRELNESDRVIAYTGLITAVVLGVRLTKGKDGKSLWSHYDMLMRLHHKPTEFDHITDKE